MFSDWVLTLKNLLFPIFCKQCGLRLLTEENGFFCPTCWEMSPRITRPFCTICGRPHQGAVGFGTLSNFPCADCREKKDLPFRRIYGAALYEGAVAEAVKLLKFHDKQQIAKSRLPIQWKVGPIYLLNKERFTSPLSGLMTNFAREEIDCEAYDFIIPVPLHKVRERERGFNQSRLLAQEILPLFPNATFDESLKRIRPTRTQSRLKDHGERRKNVIGAFAVIGDNLEGKRILLIDDVVTSGGTIEECAIALNRAHIAYVDVFAAALAT